MKKSVFGMFTLFFLLTLGWSHFARADAVTDWNVNAGEVAVAACISPALDPLHESRLYAMMHLAIHDALNAITRRSRSYALDIQGPSGASLDAAVATAAHDVLIPLLNQIPTSVFPQACIDAGVASVEADYTAALGAIPDGPAKTQGIVVGHAAAAAVLALRVTDGADTPLIDAATPRVQLPGNGALLQASSSPLRPAGPTSPPSCSATAPSSVRGRPMPSPVRAIPPISMRSKASVGTT